MSFNVNDVVYLEREQTPTLFALLTLPTKEMFMGHINSEVVNTTYKQTHRMSRLLAIVIPLCVVLSMSFPAFAQARQAAASPDSTVTKTLAGTVTGWTDNALFMGPASQNISVSISINTTTGACKYSFAPFTITDPKTGASITISSAPASKNKGKFVASTGFLSLTGSLQLQNVPVFGTVTTKTGTLSTDTTITASDGTKHSGHRLDSSNNIALAGVTSFTQLGITVHIQLFITGTLN